MKTVQLNKAITQRLPVGDVRVSFHWPINAPAFLPFKIDWLNEETIGETVTSLKQCNGAIGSTIMPLNFPYKVIWQDWYSLETIAVRIDAYPRIWVIWWMWIRMEASVKMTGQWLHYLTEIWAGLPDAAQQCTSNTCGELLGSR